MRMKAPLGPVGPNRSRSPTDTVPLTTLPAYTSPTPSTMKVLLMRTFEQETKKKTALHVPGEGGVQGPGSRGGGSHDDYACVPLSLDGRTDGRGVTITAQSIIHPAIHSRNTPSNKYCCNTLVQRRYTSM